MYGMVNKAIVDLVITQFGQATWEAIAEKAGVDEELFLSMQQYPDELTYRLVRSASEELKLPAEQVLEAFGKFWITYTAREGYGELLRISGSNIWEFLANLDNLHARVGLSFRNLRPPSFRCSEQSADGVHLHYASTRQGLTYLVVGLLKGLGDLFGTPVNVEILPRHADAPAEEVFRVSLAKSAQ